MSKAYINFANPTKSESGKTLIVGVFSVQGGSWLGYISWFAKWRRYVFCPGPETVFDANCLAAIEGKLANMTSDHKHQLRERKR